MVNKFFFLIASFLFGGAFVQASDFPKTANNKQQNACEKKLIQGSLRCFLCGVPVTEHLYTRCFLKPRPDHLPYVSGSAPGCHNRQYVQVRYSQPSGEISQEAKDKEFQATYDFISKQ